jgi:succinate dehydrogenase hydrophobic anchor subunit
MFSYLTIGIILAAYTVWTICTCAATNAETKEDAEFIENETGIPALLLVAVVVALLWPIVVIRAVLDRT